MLARTPLWLRFLGVAILGGLIALALQWAIVLTLHLPVPLMTAAVATPTTATAVVIEQVPTIGPTPPPPSAGNAASNLASLQSTLDEQGGLMLIARAERHTALAADSLSANDFAVADRELVAARGALDGAFTLVPEDLKQVIDGERREVGRIRSELQIDPEGMDERLRATQDLLLGLIVPPTQ